MFVRVPLVYLLLSLLVLLCFAPLACAAVAQKNLPEPAPTGSTAPCPGSTGSYAGSGGYANGLTGSGVSAPSIGDVWMQQGGARLYYSAQYSPRQQYTGGASRIDPACLPLLPPMKEWKATPTKKTYSKARKNSSAATSATVKNTKPLNAALTSPMQQVDSKGTSQADSTAKAGIKAAPTSAIPQKLTPSAADATKAGAEERVPLH